MATQDRHTNVSTREAPLTFFFWGTHAILTVMASPTLLFFTVVVALFITMGEAPNPSPQTPITEQSFLNYQIVGTYFKQDDPNTDPATFDYVRSSRNLCFTLADASHVDGPQLWPNQHTIRYRPLARA